jgi:hypothetical protein
LTSFVFIRGLVFGDTSFLLNGHSLFSQIQTSLRGPRHWVRYNGIGEAARNAAATIRIAISFARRSGMPAHRSLKSEIIAFPAAGCPGSG